MAAVPLPQPPINLGLVVRTDFADDTAWRAVTDLLVQPVDGFVVGLYFVDDRRYEGVTAEELLAHAAGVDITFAFLADRRTMTEPEHTLVCVDLWRERGRSFRVTPAEVAAVQNNLEIANMDFHEFADHIDPDGVFRGVDGHDEEGQHGGS